MADDTFKKLDTKSFDEFFKNKEYFISKYDAINSNYERIVHNLLENWKGKGADAFKNDAKDIKTNVGTIYDILQDMFNTLTDCYNVLKECDSSLGKYNQDPTSKEG